jgi:hypothetical protein
MMSALRKPCNAREGASQRTEVHHTVRKRLHCAAESKSSRGNEQRDERTQSTGDARRDTATQSNEQQQPAPPDEKLDFWDNEIFEPLGRSVPYIVVGFLAIAALGGFIAAGSFNKGANEVDLRGNGDQAIERALETSTSSNTKQSANEGQ